MIAHLCDWCGWLVDLANGVRCTCPPDSITARRLAAHVERRHRDAVELAWVNHHLRRRAAA